MTGYAFTYVDPSDNSLYLQTGLLPSVLVELTTSNERVYEASISQGPNASLDVFWLLFNGSTFTEYEQTYNREGSAVGKRKTIGSIIDAISYVATDACATANGGYVFAKVINNDATFSKKQGAYVLTVKTDTFGPIIVAKETFQDGPNGWVGYNLSNPSVSANADGSFNVFWDAFPISSTQPDNWKEYEQAYSSDGNPIGSQKTIFSSAFSSFTYLNDATGTSNGGYVFATVQSGAQGDETLIVKTNSLRPITVVARVNGIGGVSVASSEDGSFQVFWAQGNGFVNTEEYEQAYNAAGAPIGGPTPISTQTNSGCDVTYIPIGIDASQIGPIAANAASVAEQYNFVGVYLNPHSAGTFTAAMATEFSDAHLSLVSIYETAGMGTLAYYTSGSALQNGIKAGKTAFKEAYGDSQPSGAAIYFGIEPGGHDTYGNTTLLNDIETFFQGVAKGFSQEANLLKTTTDYAVGVYGSPTTDSTMLADGVADLSWVAATGFHNYNTYTSWSLKQTAIELPGFGTTNGVDCDVSQGANFGQWSLPSVA